MKKLLSLTTFLATTLFSLETTMPPKLPPLTKKTESEIKLQVYTTANPLPGVGLAVRSNFSHTPHNFEFSLCDGTIGVLNVLNGSINYILAPKPEGFYLGTGLGFSHVYYQENGAATTPIIPVFVGYQGAKGFIDAGSNFYTKEAVFIPTIRLGLSF